MSIAYMEFDHSQIGKIEGLWVKLNKLHSQLSPYFAEEYACKKFGERKNELLKKSKNGILKIFMAKDDADDIYAGYCVCSVIGITGEVDSLFVEEKYRKHNIGKELLRRADEFFKCHSVKKQILSVYAGNENVMKFYNKNGYHQKYVIMEKECEK